MGWTSLGDAVCDSCPAERVGSLNRQSAIQMIRAGGWHHMIGSTIGGVPFEAILCPRCARDERKRPRTTVVIDQDALPFDWEEFRKVERGEGFQSR